MSKSAKAVNYAIDQTVMDMGNIRVPLWLMGGVARNVPVIALRNGTQRFLPFNVGDTVTFDNVNDPTNRCYVRHCKYEVVIVTPSEVRLRCVTYCVSPYKKGGKKW